MGDAQTGVTIMFTDRGLDTGDMAISEAVDIGPEETAGELSDRLSLLGARLLVRAIHLIEDGSCPRVPQDETLATYEPMLKREDGLIDWAVSARKICDKVRGFNPWPGTYTVMPDGSALKIWACAARPDKAVPPDVRPGSVLLSSAKGGLFVACREGVLEILEMQAAGTKRMTAKAYLMGKSLPEGIVLGEVDRA